MANYVCRVCKKKILEKYEYCPYCGWINRRIEIPGDKLYFIKPDKTEDLKTDICIKYEGSTPVNANFEIKGNNSIFFEDGTQTKTFTFDKENYNTLTFVFKFESGKHYNDRDSFTLEGTANDYPPMLDSIHEEITERPYGKNKMADSDYYRDISIEFEIILSEYTKLETDRALVIFNKSNSTMPELISIFNIGECDAVLKNVECDDVNFEIILPEDPVIIKNKSAVVTINYKGGPLIKDFFKEAQINYMIGNKEDFIKIYFYISEQEEKIDPLGYDNIIAIDFGTSKTAVSYLVLRDLKESEAPEDNIENLIFEGKDIVEPTDSMPSCIGYNGKNIYIGELAVLNWNEKDWACTDRIKTHLRDDKISFTTGEPKEVSGVVKDFFKTLKNYHLKKFTEVEEDGHRYPVRNKYIITLPVLDDGEEKENKEKLYEKQQDVTIKSAEAVFLTEYMNMKNDDIYTLKESQAAMFSIVNIIQKHPPGWKNINLNSGDIICVFDYGAGTLDISFGIYDIRNDKPNIIKIADIGRYYNKDNQRINLGGDRIDNNMFISFLKKMDNMGTKTDENVDASDIESIIGEGGAQKKEYKKSVKFNGSLSSDKEDGSDILLNDENGNNILLRDDNGNILFKDKAGDTTSIASESDYYPGEDLKTIRDAVGKTKIEISESYWETEYGEDKVVVTAGFTKDNIDKISTFSKETFKNIISEDINAAIKEMLEVINSNELLDGDKSKIKYIFLVGGSSLFKEIKEKLSDEFGEGRVYSPYDYAYEDDINDGIDEKIHTQVRKEAVHSIARGAVLSYLTKIENVLNFDVKIQNEDNELDIDNMFDFKKHATIPIKSRTFEISKPVGNVMQYSFNIMACINDNNVDVECLLGKAVITPENFGENSKIFMRTAIDENRKLQVEYSPVRSGTYESANKNELEIIV